MEKINNLQIDVSTALRKIMLDKKLKQYEVGEKLNIDKKPFNRIIQRNDFKVNDVSKLANALECEIQLVFIDKKSGKQWLCEPKEDNNDLHDNE